MADKNKRSERTKSSNSRSFLPVQSKASSKNEQFVSRKDRQKVDKKTSESLRRQNGFEESLDKTENDGQECRDEKIDGNKSNESVKTWRPGVQNSEGQDGENSSSGSFPDVQNEFNDQSLKVSETSSNYKGLCDVEEETVYKFIRDERSADDSGSHCEHLNMTSKAAAVTNIIDHSVYNVCLEDNETQVIENNVSDSTGNSKENGSFVPTNERQTHKDKNYPISDQDFTPENHKHNVSDTKRETRADVNNEPISGNAETRGASGICEVTCLNESKSCALNNSLSPNNTDERSKGPPICGKNFDHDSDNLNSFAVSQSTLETDNNPAPKEQESQDNAINNCPISENVNNLDVTRTNGSTNERELGDDGIHSSPVSDNAPNKDDAINNIPITEKSVHKRHHADALSTNQWDGAINSCPINNSSEDKDNSNSSMSSTDCLLSKHEVNKLIPEEEDTEISKDGNSESLHSLARPGRKDSDGAVKNQLKPGSLKQQWRDRCHSNSVTRRTSSDDVSSVSTDSGHDSWKRRWIGQGSGSSQASDNVFVGPLSNRTYSSVSNLTSISSISSAASQSRDTNTSRKRFELRHRGHIHGTEDFSYLTPLQRREREVKELRIELSDLLRENAEKDEEIASLKRNFEDEKKKMQDEQNEQITDLTNRQNAQMSELSDTLNAQITELTEKLDAREKTRFEVEEKLCQSQDELEKMDTRYTELKRQVSEKEEQFESYLMDMYVKGQRAAMFEREEELEMLASNRKSRVTVTELTRKLSRTEQELAKWQGLKLGESYSKPDRPETQADVTLSFLKDAFYHFLSDTSGNEVHLRAILKILSYTPEELGKIREGLEELKRLDRKKVFKS